MLIIHQSNGLGSLNLSKRLFLLLLICWCFDFVRKNFCKFSTNSKKAYSTNLTMRKTRSIYVSHSFILILSSNCKRDSYVKQDFIFLLLSFFYTLLAWSPRSSIFIGQLGHLRAIGLHTSGRWVQCGRVSAQPDRRHGHHVQCACWTADVPGARSSALGPQHHLGGALLCAGPLRGHSLHGVRSQHQDAAKAE